MSKNADFRTAINNIAARTMDPCALAEFDARWDEPVHIEPEPDMESAYEARYGYTPEWRR